MANGAHPTRPEREGIHLIAAAVALRNKREAFRRTGVKWSLSDHLDRVAAGVADATCEDLAIAPSRQIAIASGPTFTLQSLVVFTVREEDSHRRVHTRACVRLGAGAVRDQGLLANPDTTISAESIRIRYDFRALRPAVLTVPGPVSRVSLLKSLSEQVRAMFEREGGVPKKKSEAAARDVADAPCGLWGTPLDALRLRFAVRAAAPDAPWHLAVEV
jgi:hypothetical protein